MKPPTRIPEMSPRALKAKMKHNMKHVVVMVLLGVRPVNEHCVVWQLRNFSWNNQLPMSSTTKLLAETEKSASFPKQQPPPTRPYGITPQTTAVLTFVANHCGSHVHRKTTAVLTFTTTKTSNLKSDFIHLQSDIECKLDFEIKVMWIINMLFAMLQA